MRFGTQGKTSLLAGALGAVALAVLPAVAAGGIQPGGGNGGLPATPCDRQARNHVIEIGSTVSCKLVFVSKAANNGKGNTILWRASDPSLKVAIEFESGSGLKNPFPNVGCSLASPKNVCKSGDLDTTLSADEHYVYFYHAYLVDADGNSVEIDPGVIIKP
jgi:hypothetical protein